MFQTERAMIGKLFFLLRKIGISPFALIPAMTLSLLAAAFEGVGLSLLVPLLTGFLTMDYSFIKGLPVLSSVLQLLPDAILNSDRALFGVLLAVFVCVIVLKSVFRYCASMSVCFVSTRALHHLRKHIFHHYLYFGKAYFDQTATGRHSTLLSQLTIYALLPLTMLDKGVSASFSLIAYLVVMLSMSWQLTLVMFPVFFLLHFSIKGVLRNIRGLSKTFAEQASLLGQKAVEMISVMTLVQLSNMQLQEKDHFTRLSDDAARVEFRRNAASHLIRPIQEIFSLGAVLFLLGGMLYLLVETGSGTASSFLIYFYVVLNATNKFSAITSFWGDISTTQGSMDAVLAVFDEEDKEHVEEGRDVFPGLKVGISWKNLTFAYPQNPRSVLQDVSFTVEKGKRVAIVGPTGAGKSTIFQLLLRFYDCPKGAISIDGRDLRSFTTASLRSKMALVSQETLLLNDTLLHNMTYGIEKVSDAHIADVLKRARLEEVVTRLPQGLHTVIGERGTKLSGGEKQRLAIARALLREVDVLLLDEATSALDAHTERKVQEAMEEAMNGRTAIVIAHRLATVQHADWVVVLEAGKVAEQGTWDELLGRKGRLHTLWEAQQFQ